LPDISNVQAFFKRDVTEGRPGLVLSLVLTIVDTSQNCQPLANAALEISFPETTSAAVYATVVYSSKGRSPTSNSDMVLSDGTSTELATLNGTVSAGYTAALTVGVPA
jgi:hypothetical protein